MFERCPKCGHHPLPRDQALPAECPACGVILAKVAAARAARAGSTGSAGPTAANTARAGGGAGAADTGLAGRFANATDEPERWTDWLAPPPGPVDPLVWWGRAALLALFLPWGLWLIRCDHRTGEIAGSFLHGPLLVFHEAGHVIFRFGGEWLTIFGGTLGQLLMPAILAGALLLKNRDPFGAAIGLWLLGVSLLDVAPYVHDALHPQLILLGGHTGEEGGHDWIYLLSSVGWLDKAPMLGALVHKLGALVVLAALAWAGWTLQRQRGRTGDTPLRGR